MVVVVVAEREGRQPLSSFFFFFKLQHSGHSRGGAPDFTLVSSRHRNRNKPGKQKKTSSGEKWRGLFFLQREFASKGDGVLFYSTFILWGGGFFVVFFFFRATGQRLHPQRLLAKIKHTPALCLKSNQAPLSAPFSSRS